MKRASNWFWGIFLLLAAVVVIVGQVTGFAQLGFWSILALVLLAAVLVKSLAELNLTGTLLSAALIYVVLQRPFSLFYISPWLLILAALLAGIGLSMIIRPKRFRRHSQAWMGASHGGHWQNGHWQGGHWEDGRWVQDENENTYHTVAAEAGDFTVDDTMPKNDGAPPTATENMGDENHPRSEVSFGGASRYVHGDAVESGFFRSSFGSLEVFFDNAQISPNGAEIYVDVSLGNMEFYLPRTWNVKEAVSVSLGAVSHSGLAAMPDPAAPLVVITGEVSLGNLEIHHI